MISGLGEIKLKTVLKPIGIKNVYTSDSASV